MDRQVELALRAGFNVHEVAELLQIPYLTMNMWKEIHPSFGLAFSAAKNAWDERIEASFARRAMGYEHDSEHIHVTRDGEIVRVNTTKHVPADVTAAMFWLKNRQPDRWKDRKETELTGPNGGAIQLANVTDVERAKALQAFMLKQLAAPEEEESKDP